MAGTTQIPRVFRVQIETQLTASCAGAGALTDGIKPIWAYSDGLSRTFPVDGRYHSNSESFSSSDRNPADGVMRRCRRLDRRDQTHMGVLGRVEQNIPCRWPVPLKFREFFEFRSKPS